MAGGIATSVEGAEVVGCWDWHSTQYKASATPMPHRWQYTILLEVGGIPSIAGRTKKMCVPL